MTQPSAAALRRAAVFCGIVGLYDAFYVITTLSGSAALGYKIDVLFSDFLVFHAAARAFFEGKLSLVYDTVAITHLQNTLYAARLPFELGFRSFLYPPLWLLDLLPFGLLPVGVSVAAFLILTAGICVVALLAIGLRIEAVAAILTAPAAVWVVVAGQNTFLSAALLYGGMALLQRRPVSAGVLLGLLAYKPQLWVLVPVALLAARAWRPLIAMSITVLALTLATLLLFGADFWLAFLDAARRAGTGAAAAEMYGRVGTHMTTLLAAAKRVGLGNEPAMALQLAGSMLAVATVAWAFARRRHSYECTAVLVTATFLVSPYTLNYDLLLMIPAVALLFLHPPPEGYQPAERTIYMAVWLIPTFCMALNAAELPVTPLIILLFGATAWARLKAQPKVELPSAVAAG